MAFGVGMLGWAWSDPVLATLGFGGGRRHLRSGSRQIRHVDGTVAPDDEIHVRRIELHFLQHDRTLPDGGDLGIDDQAREARDGIAGLLGQRRVADAQPEGEWVEGNIAEGEAPAELFAHILLCVDAQQVRYPQEPGERVDDDQRSGNAERKAMQREDREQRSKHWHWAACQFLFLGCVGSMAPTDHTRLFAGRQ